MNNFDIVDIILFLGVSQGLFLAVSLSLIRNRNKSANRILSLLLFCAVAMLFGRIAITRIPADWVLRIGVLVDTTIFLFGPLIYMYIRRLLYVQKRPYRLAWYHYVPAGLHLIFYLWTLTIPLLYFKELYFNGTLNLMFFIVEASGLALFIGYVIGSFTLSRKHKKDTLQNFSFTPKVRQFIHLMLFALSSVLVLWGCSFISVQFLGRRFALMNYELMWMATPIFIYLVGYYALRQPEIFKIRQSKKSTISRPRMTESEIATLEKRLRFYIQDEKVYLDSDLTLKALAQKVNTSSNNLSWYLNHICNTSFYDYINHHRIKAFTVFIDEEVHQKKTLLSLAMDVGFNSKSTFNKAFKKEMGVTPTAYIKGGKVA